MDATTVLFEHALSLPDASCGTRWDCRTKLAAFGMPWHPGPARPLAWHHHGVEQADIDRRWTRIAADVHATVGRSLDVLLVLGEDSWWKCRYSLDGVDMGGFGHHFASDEEAFVAELAGDLREHGVDEEIWGGWPDCPVHMSHPLDPVLDQTNTAVWQCPDGRIIARIGDLRPQRRI